MYNFLAFLFAVAAVTCYTIYSRKYEYVSRDSNNILLSSLLLYFIAAIQLFILTIITTIIWQHSWNNFAIPQDTKLWASKFFTEINSLTDIFISFAIVAIGYAFSIFAETKSRTILSYGTFDIVYQLNTVIVVLISSFFFYKELSFIGIFSALAVLIGSLMPLIVAWKEQKINGENKILFWAILSGVTCGIALFTDSNLLSKQLIFYPTFKWEQTPLFIFYEGLTFGLPFILLTIVILFQYRLKVILYIFKKEWRKFYKEYIIAAFWSAGFYVTGVYALYLSANNSSLLAPSILAATPLVNVIADKSHKTILQKITEYIASIIVLLGLILVAIYT